MPGHGGGVNDDEKISHYPAFPSALSSLNDIVALSLTAFYLTIPMMAMSTHFHAVALRCIASIEMGLSS